MGIFVYCLLFCMCIIFSIKANRTENKKYLWAIVIMMTFVAGFRGNDVGIDTQSYIKIFGLLSKGQMQYVYGIEQQFKIFVTLLLHVINSPTFIFVICSAIIYGFIIFRLWDYRKVASFSWMVTVFYTIYYFMTLNIMRQFCAVAIIFYATRYLEKKNYKMFLLFIGMAFVFHNTALMGIVFFVIEITQWNNITKKQRLLLIAMIGTIPLIMPYVLLKMSAYRNYFSMNISDVGIMLIFKMLIYLISGLGLCFAVYMKNSEFTFKQIKYKINTVRIYYLLGIFLTGLGYFFKYMDRVGLIFYIFECVYWGIIVKNGKYIGVYKLILSVLLLFIFVTSMSGNGQGQLPYLFVWQQTIR